MRGTGLRGRLRNLLRGAASTKPPADPQEEADQHPERLAVLPYCIGKGIDIGCGFRKTTPECIGVDRLAKGAIGQDGVMKGNPSVADVCASGDDLYMFQDGALDFVVARHNLEHYIDVFKTLREWKRVLRRGGVMAIVLPDERSRNTIALDPTHKHAFTPESLVPYIELLGGLEITKLVDVVPDWSFMCVCRKVGD